VEQPIPSAGETLISTIRHGLTELNRDRRVGGRVDVPLIPEGREQAREAAATFAGTAFDVVVSSPLRRSIETASIVTGRPVQAIEIDELCTERSFGEMEGIDPAEVPRRFPDVRYRRIGHIGYSLNPPGGEPFEDLHARADRFLDGLLGRHRGKRVLVFSHQNFLQQLHGVLRGFDAMGSLEHDILNCELNQFLVSPEGILRSHRTVQLCGTAARYPSF
jgi:ribonuclease H / adenosylcobalamin/alpha-ribazole phosphatase